jgi:hypothetical protein
MQLVEPCRTINHDADVAKRKSESEIVSRISRFHNSDSDDDTKSLYRPGLSNDVDGF